MSVFTGESAIRPVMRFRLDQVSVTTNAQGMGEPRERSIRKAHPYSERRRLPDARSRG
jgi:hypothetical protein